VSVSNNRRLDNMDAVNENDVDPQSKKLKKKMKSLWRNKCTQAHTYMRLPFHHSDGHSYDIVLYWFLFPFSCIVIFLF
jgi:hypothetical protein